MVHEGSVRRSTSAIAMSRQIPFRVEPLLRAAVRRGGDTG
jgi:hypothetical protein